jgi:hypothetical protein
MDVLHLLEELGTVDPVDPVVLDRTTRLVVAAATARSTASIASIASIASNDDGTDRLAPSPGPAPRRRWTKRAVAAAVVVAVAVGTGTLVSPDSPVGPSPAAAGVLRHLADVAAAQPAPTVPGAGQYLYVDSQEAYTSTSVEGSGDTFTVLQPKERQIWIGADGSGRLLQTDGTPSFLTPTDRAHWVAAGSPPLTSDVPDDTSFGPGGLSDGPLDLATLPTDPTALARELSARKIEGGPPGAAEDFTQIGDLLRETDASPALRAALYQVASSLTGVELLGTVTDHDGRAGIGIAYLDHGTRQELIFDPQTSALLGEQYTVVSAGSGYDVAPGTVVGWAVYLHSSVVASTTATKSPVTSGTGPAPA